MAKEFSVFDSLGDFTPVLNQMEEVYRNPYDLIPSKGNFYSPEIVNEIAESILQFGQLQPALIDVRDGKEYVLLGHTRRLAYIKLIEEGHEEFKKMRCEIFPRKEIEEKYGEDADTVIELIDIQGNLQRNKTDWQKMMELIRTEAIVKKMKKPGRIIDLAAKTLKMSGSQARRYKATYNNLCKQLMDEFEKNNIRGNVAYELSKLSPEFQKQACEIFQIDETISLEDVKKLQAQENADKSIPGQMSIAQATGQLRPQADTTPIDVETQIKRLYDKAQKRLKERVENRDKLFLPTRLKDLYNGSRVQNGYLNYKAEKACIIFNPDSEEEKEIHWNDLADILIQKYGKKPKPVKTTTIDAPEPVIALTESAAVKAFCEAYPGKLKTIMRICRRCKDNGEAAKAVQLEFAPGGFSAASGGKVNYSFMSFSAGLEIEVNSEKVSMKYGRLIVEAKNLYDPFSPEFDIEEKKTETKNDEGPAKCITGQSRSGICGVAAYCNKEYNCCTQCPEDCNGRCGWIPKKSCQPAAETPDKKQQKDHYGETTEMAKYPRNTDKIPDAWPKELKDIPVPTDVEIIGYLYDEERKLKEVKKDPELPHMAIYKQQLIVAGLQLIKNLVEDRQEEPEQPELPIMRNNDQRKEWLRNYKNWGLWYTDNHTGVSYYKYDFENGARLIAEEYQPDPDMKNEWWVGSRQETAYLHLVGGPEPSRKDAVPKWTHHSRYNKYPNSDTELVEFLKEVQK